MGSKLKAWLTSAFLMASCNLAFTQSAKRDVTLDDLLSLHSITGLAIAPDGKQIAYCLDGQLYVNGEPWRTPIRLAGGTEPSWSPDARWLAYYAQQDSKPQLWVVESSGGIPKPLTDESAGVDVSAPAAWSSDGTRLLVAVTIQVRESTPTAVPDSAPLIITEESPPWLASSGLFRGTNLVRNQPPPNRRQVLVIARTGQGTHALSGEDENAAEPAWSPDGSAVAYLVFSATAEWTAELTRFDLATGVRSILAKGTRRMSFPRWSPDGSRIAYLDDGERYGFFTAAFVVPASRGQGPARNISLSVDRNVLGLDWSPEGHSLIAELQDGVNMPIGRLSLNGRFEPISRSDVKRTQMSVAHSGSLAWVESEPEHLDRIWIGDAHAAQAQPVVDPNPQMVDWKLGPQRVIRWRNSRGDELEGILTLPPDYRTGTRVPLIVDPYSHRCNDFKGVTILANRYLAAQGYGLFFPNHRGFFTVPKSLEGVAYAKIAQLPNSADIMADDILSGVDELVREGVADPDRLGLYSFSTGASGIDALLTKTTRFKAAVSGGGVADWIHYYLLRPTDDDTIPSLLEGRTPWDAPDLYRALSPVYQADRIYTPLLLFVGDKDTRLLDSVHFYHALRRLNRPVTLVRYPDQGHGVPGDKLQEHWQRCVTFFRQYGVR